jgi:hypothetical protein
MQKEIYNEQAPEYLVPFVGFWFMLLLELQEPA